MFLSAIRRRGQAVQVADRAIESDPLNPVAFFTKALILGDARNYIEAAKLVRRAMKLAPGLHFLQPLHGYFQMMLGNEQLAQSEFDATEDSDAYTMSLKAVLAARQGDLAKSNEISGLFRGLAVETGDYSYAQILAQQRRNDEAIDALRKALAARDPGMIKILVDPLLDPLRADDRFQALVIELDFPT